MLEKVAEVCTERTVVAFVEDTALLREKVPSRFPFISLAVTADRTSEVSCVWLVALYLESIETIRNNTSILTVNPLTHYMSIY